MFAALFLTFSALFLIIYTIIFYKAFGMIRYEKHLLVDKQPIYFITMSPYQYHVTRGGFIFWWMWILFMIIYQAVFTFHINFNNV